MNCEIHILLWLYVCSKFQCISAWMDAQTSTTSYYDLHWWYCGMFWWYWLNSRSLHFCFQFDVFFVRRWKWMCGWFLSWMQHVRWSMAKNRSTSIDIFQCFISWEKKEMTKFKPAESIETHSTLKWLISIKMLIIRQIFRAFKHVVWL